MRWVVVIVGAIVVTAITVAFRFQDGGEPEELTRDAAKRALLAMDYREIRPGVIMPMPRNEPIEMIDEDEFAMGIYQFNLKTKTFHASADYPKAMRHKFNHVIGVFERNADGKWVAKVREGISGH